MEIASRLLLYSLSCLGLVGPGAAEEPAFSPDHAEAPVIKSSGVVCQASGYPRARSPRLPPASSWSGVSEARTTSSSLKTTLFCLILHSTVPSREVVC